jgi:hypothetical protein|tara:strand:- start:3196 stop:3441 length:246 start_codon:yes stop_codon:yes gene_type:complete
MVFFTVTAQLLDTILLRTTIFTLEQFLNIIKWGGSSMYSYYYPSLSETDKLRLENTKLKQEIEYIRQVQNNEILLLKDAEY